MKANISNLLEKSLKQSASGLAAGIKPKFGNNVLLSPSELEEFAKTIARDCIQCLDEPPIGCAEWTQMLNDIECIKQRFGL